MLVTADNEYAPQLGVASKTAWRIILLPTEDHAQADVLRKMVEGHLIFRPSAERSGMLEYVRRNRLLLDFRHSTPVVTVHSDCHWLGNSR